MYFFTFIYYFLLCLIIPLSVELVSINAPPMLSTAAQGLLAAIYDGIGNATGILIGEFLLFQESFN